MCQKMINVRKTYRYRIGKVRNSAECLFRVIYGAVAYEVNFLDKPNEDKSNDKQLLDVRKLKKFYRQYNRFTYPILNTNLFYAALFILYMQNITLHYTRLSKLNCKKFGKNFA